jgi:hypothetical protein
MPGEALLTVRGVPENAAITEINVRGGPGTNQAALFKLPVGTAGLRILAVQPDVENKNLNGKVYIWFQMSTPQGQAGWVRDDLLFLEGDARTWGYPDLAQRTWAFAMTRSAPGAGTSTAAFTTVPVAATLVTPAAVQPVQPVTVQPVQPVSVQPVQPVAVQPVQPVTVQPVQPVAAAVQPVQPAAVQPVPAALPGDMNRVRKVAFLITALFEGHGYAAYNNYDAGIVSYGLIQFTLAAGSLVTVINRYLERSTSETAGKLRGYQPAVNARDPNLRNDVNFKNLLIAAAAEPAMQQVQDEVATAGFWQQVVDGYITPRNLVLPCTYALLFDMGVNFGVNHGFVRLAEEQLGIPPRSPAGTNGITEPMLMTRVAELRKQSHDRQAERDNLPGLKVRGDFWVNLVRAGDWQMQGDAAGMMNVKGKLLNVRSPA